MPPRDAANPRDAKDPRDAGNLRSRRGEADASENFSGRILRSGGGIYHIGVDGTDTIVEASLSGRLKRSGQQVASVGDFVEVEGGGAMRIARVWPRRSTLARRAGRRQEQVIVANVDLVAVVISVAAPKPDLLIADRLIAAATLNDIQATLVVNKTDLARRGQTATANELKSYAALGVETIRTSVRSGAGLASLAERLTGMVTVLSGQSGVGKSSLINALVPGLGLRVGRVGVRRALGRHTTVATELYRYPPGGYLADTPGLQYISLWDLDPAAVQRGFSEIAAASAGCKFANCRHRAEPDCAVMSAVRAGEIGRRRYDSYLRLLAEAEEARPRRSPRDP